MSLAAYLGLLGAWVLAITVPGPDTVQLIRLGARSRRSAVFAALGICTGNVLWPVVTMLGLAALIAAFPWILTVLYLFGGCFLIYMGQGAFRSGYADWRARAVLPAVSLSDATRAPTAAGGVQATARAPLGDFASWRLGLATNLSNPKALLFFGSVFAQFIPVDVSLLDRLLVLVLMTVVGVAWFCGFALAVAAGAEKIQRINPFIEMVAGVLFVVLGAFLAFEGVQMLVGS
ncbi:LysE family translocator [Corynebacterium jeikeium]|uniref:LysE family translocator n=1 Tax=Corynebacterium jeikeium TaxID=38289 RepID=UPI0001B716B7|nr:LysE family translocator [Corynebacterium jeikeium]EEW15585.1 translocator protein, LysE family [Corynebacterium jeikeium ATCC 43734]OOD31179.1 threonine transporter RhtB [Corynebacterium jeikeium]WCZ52630.1 Threonine efflux protein [Corynebacterium jeikeium]SUY82064.1 putative threonine efflux protein [Corynebacterium jeikeium]